MRQHWLEPECIAHLDVDRVRAGDTVVGTLPVHLAAEVCARGATYLHLRMHVPLCRRGTEIADDEMADFGAELQRYLVGPPS